MEHLALYDYVLAQSHSPKSLKSKHQILFGGIPLSSAVIELSMRAQHDRFNLSDSEEVVRLVTWLYGQLSSTLKETVKYVNSKHNSLKNFDLQVAKNMFEAVIRCPVSTCSGLTDKLKSIEKLLASLLGLYDKVNK
jgi:hypothetical protein